MGDRVYCVTPPGCNLEELSLYGPVIFTCKVIELYPRTSKVLLRVISPHIKDNILETEKSEVIENESHAKELYRMYLEEFIGMLKETADKAVEKFGEQSS